MMLYYIEIDGKPVPVDDVQEWGEWFHKNDRTVDKTNLPNDVRVSTVFLGLDHSYGPGPPVLYETMVFDDTNSGQFTQRYTSREEAQKGHDKVVMYLKSLYNC